MIGRKIDTSIPATHVAPLRRSTVSATASTSAISPLSTYIAVRSGILQRGQPTNAEHLKLKIRIKALAEDITRQQQDFADQPYPTYKSICSQHRHDGHDFAFPPLIQFIALMQLQLHTIITLGYNPFPLELGNCAAAKQPQLLAPEALKSPEFSAQQLLKRFAAVLLLQCPYQRTWHLVLDYIIFLSSTLHPTALEAIYHRPGYATAHHSLDQFLTKSRILCMPVMGYFSLDFFSSLCFAPIYPIGITLRLFNHYDAFKHHSPFQFLLHDISHARTMAGSRDGAMHLFQWGWRQLPVALSPEEFHTALSHRITEHQLISDLLTTLIKRDSTLGHCAQALFVVLMHESPFISQATRTALQKQLQKMVAKEELDIKLDAMLADFSPSSSKELRLRAAHTLMAALQQSLRQISVQPRSAI